MPRLSDSTVTTADAALPGYDRGELRCGIVHLGLGAFARAHLAVYADDLLAAGHQGVGIIGVSLRNDDVPNALDPQDGLYALGVVDGTTTSHRVIGSVRQALHAPSEGDAVREALASADTTIVAVTVTEKGYCIDPATRRLDLAHPDIRHDVDHPDRPRSVVGHLVLAARDRRAGGAGDLTVLSLDNLSANGSTLQSVVSELAAVGDASLAEWIGAHAAFPNSMVDRMVPATDDDFREAVAAAIGLDDAWPVRAERYSQWVVEGRWATPMPPLGDVGVQIVDDVGPWEMLKLRVLNSLHTAAAHYGLRHGLSTIDLVAADQGGRALLDRVAAEIAEVLVGPPGADVDGYIATTLERFANSGLGHRCDQVATDTSQKLPQRLPGTIRDRLERGLAIDALADVLALWAWSTLGVDHRGEPRTVSDPLATTYARIVADCTTDGRVDTSALATALIGLPIFGDLAGNPALVGPVATRLPAVLDRTEHLEMKS